LLSNETLRFNILNSLTAQLNDSYANLLGNYSQLLQAYESLYSSYQQHLIDENQNVQNVHSLMYIFATATAVLIVATVYFSKRLFLQPKEHSERREPILGQGSGS